MAESRNFEIYGCWICEVSFIKNPLEHIESKEHKKFREDLIYLSE